MRAKPRLAPQLVVLPHESLMAKRTELKGTFALPGSVNSIHLSIHPSISLSNCLSVSPSICSFTHPSICCVSNLE